jgi:L-malate glycosyltransferase
MNLSVCFIADGSSIHTRRWLAPFANRGHHFSLLSTTEPAAGLPVEEVVDLSKIGRQRKVRFAQRALEARRYLSTTRPQILHALQLNRPGLLAALTWYRPMLGSAWGSDVLIAPEMSASRKLMFQFVNARCEFLTVPSEMMYSKALSLGVPESRLILLPWGLETDRFRPDYAKGIESESLHLQGSSRETLLLCPRAISPLYNIDVVIRSVHKALETLPGLRLLLLRFNADPTYLKQVEWLISELGLHDVVKWAPAQAGMDAMAELYRKADIVISVPSSEGYGFTVLEAMACGTPTIISDLSVFGDRLRTGEHTLRVPPGDVAATAQAILEMVKNVPLRNAIRRNGYNYASAENVESRVRAVEELYARVLGRE